ncbi:MAG: mannose-1-phosphate guanylyltransferase [Phycisphaeraceae bacterium]|nr:MAG: mannose-1-phosphate guanylyltransferase [Phycisphaeraceae bacterium]
MRYAMIMAGGSGTRLWPMSRAGEPKQLIRFIERPGTSERVSLLELAANRLEGVVPLERRYICTGEGHREVIRDRLPDFTDERILGEPLPRDTVNAVGFSAAVFSKMDPGAVFAVLTADHLIRPQATFAHAMDVGFSIAENDPTQLVSFGIRPSYPATGFGYIENGGALPGTDGLGFKVARFVEKPPLDKAREYVGSGRFSWNAGMFVFHARTFMDLLKRHKPESFAGLKKIQDAWDTEQQQDVIDRVYPTLPKISVDYAVMEPAASDPKVSLAGVRMDVEWLDVGSWPSYGETLEADKHGNRVSGGSVALHDARNNMIVSSSDSHTVALLGCDDLIVVHTPGATLVMPRHRAQDLKKLHEELPDDLK